MFEVSYCWRKAHGLVNAHLRGFRSYCSFSFELYEDDGVSRDYEKGIYSTISFLWDDANSTLTIGERQGTFAGMLLV